MMLSADQVIRIANMLCWFVTVVHGMTVEKITPNKFGSLGGVRLKIEGTGFPTYPRPPPDVLIGGESLKEGVAEEVEAAVSSCNIVPYLSTQTVLICDTTRSSTFVDSHRERDRLNGRYQTFPLRVIAESGREATCVGPSTSGVPCGVTLHNEKVPSLTTFENSEVKDYRSVTSGDLLVYRGDRLRNAHQNSKTGNPDGHSAKIRDFSCVLSGDNDQMAMKNNWNSGQCQVEGHPDAGPANLSLTVIYGNEGIAHARPSVLSEDARTGSLYMFDVAPQISSIANQQTQSIKGGGLLVISGAGFGSVAKNAVVNVGDVPCVVETLQQDEIVCRITSNVSSAHYLNETRRLWQGGRGASIDVWTDLSGDSSNINEVKQQLSFSQPSFSQTLDGFSNKNKGRLNLDRYGARIRGWIKIPRTGNYTFSVRADDASELWISSDANPENAKLVYASCCVNHDWVDVAESRRELQMNDYIYLHLLYKEGHGGDYGEVGITMEDPTHSSAQASTIIDTVQKITVKGQASTGGKAGEAGVGDAFVQAVRIQRTGLAAESTRVGDIEFSLSLGNRSTSARLLRADASAADIKAVVETLPDSKLVRRGVSDS